MRIETRSRAHFARVVEQVADQIGQILRFAPEPEAGLQRDVEGQDLIAVQLLESADEPLDDRLHLRRRAEGSGPGGGARAVEIERDLPAHDLGLFTHLFGQGRAL